jgi:hypothetical protein
VSVKLKIQLGSVFLYLKQVVFSSTYSFYGILTKITLPVS